MGEGGKGPGQGRKGALASSTLASSVSARRRMSGEAGEKLDTLAAPEVAKAPCWHPLEKTRSFFRANK